MCLYSKTYISTARSEALNKVEMIVKIMEVGFVLIRVHNLGCKKDKEQWKRFLSLRRSQFLPHTLPLPLIALRIGNHVFLTIIISDRSNFFG